MSAPRHRILPITILASLAMAVGCHKNPFTDLPAQETIDLPGLAGPVEVLRDTWGIPHIYCTEDLDCIEAQGYVQAHDRFFEMDLFRNYGKGSLGHLFGANPAVRSVDRWTRRVMTHRDDGRHVAEHIVEALDPEMRAYLEAFARGVNAYLDEMGQSPRAPVPGEYDFGLILDGAETPEPWTPTDTIAIGRLFSMMLSEGLDEELAAADMAAKLDPALLADLRPAAPLDPTFVLPDYYGSGHLGRPWRPPAALIARMRAIAPLVERALAARSKPAGLHHLFGSEPGSNNWIVSADRSATGRVLVADDPHLALWSPAVWTEVQLDATSLPGARGRLKARGVAFPGTPGVVIGHNAHLAWAVTTTGYDVSDLYVETVTGVDRVRFEGKDVEVRRFVIRFPRGPLPDDGFDEEKVCVVPHHGPLFSVEGFSETELADPDLPCVDPARGTTAISGRWTGMEVSDEFSAFRQLSLASTIEEAKAAWQSFEVGAQNLLVGDDAGGVLYYPHARVPIREGDLSQNPPWLPMPGEGGHEWKGDIPADDLPQVTNPPSGFIVTANNDIAGVTADGDPTNDTYYLYRTRDLGLRAGRITRRLQAALEDGSVDLDEMRSIQTDRQSDLAARFVPHLLAAAEARPDLVSSLDLAGALDRLKAWDFTQPTGLAAYALDAEPASDPGERAAAIATSIFAAWFFHAIDDTFGDELAAAGTGVARRVGRADQSLQKALFFALEQDKAALFDDVATEGVTETKEEILLGALREALDELSEKLGTDPEGWLWGRLHQVKLLSIFGVFGLPNEFDLGPLPQGGGFHTINVANFNSAYLTTNGPSVRMITDVIPGAPASEQMIPGGAIDLAGHPNQGDQLVPWLEGRYKEVVDTPDAVHEAAAARDASGVDPAGRWIFRPTETSP